MIGFRKDKQEDEWPTLDELRAEQKVRQAEEFDRMVSLGFRPAPMRDPLPPYVCETCGCHVSPMYAEQHRGRCQS